MSAKDILISAAGASGLPITFVASASGISSGGAGDLTLNKPTGTIDGDVMIALISLSPSGAGAAAPAGWQALYASDIDSPAIQIYAKVAASEGASYLFTGGSFKAGVIVTYRNASVGLVGIRVAGSTTCVAPQVNLPIGDSLLLACYTASVSATTFTTPSGMSLVASSPGTGQSWAMFSQANLPSGLTGTRTSTASNNASGIMLFLTPTSYVAPTISFIASANKQNTSASDTLAINKPTGTVDGDLMLAFMSAASHSTAITWAGDTGWTEIADQGLPPDLRIAYKVAASEGSSYTFTASGSTLTLAGSILTYRGASYESIGPIESNSPDPLTATGLSTAQNYAKLVGFCTQNIASIALTAQLGMTVRVQNNDATSPSYVIADQTVGYGPTGDRKFTNLTSSVDKNSAVLLTIIPT